MQFAGVMFSVMYFCQSTMWPLPMDLFKPVNLPILLPHTYWQAGGWPSTECCVNVVFFFHNKWLELKIFDNQYYRDIKDIKGK